MKKLLMVTLAVFAFAACGKDDEKPGANPDAGNPEIYNVTVSSSDTSYGTVTPTDVQAGEAGTTFTVTATPEDGYKFVNWTCTGEGTQVASAASESTTATIGTSDGTITANFAEIEANFVTPVAPYILYWDNETNRMQLGAWGGPGDGATTGGKVSQDNMLFFQFGSVVGLSMTSNADTWTGMEDVKFNPPGTTYAATEVGYQNIPSWNGTSTEDGYISSDAYHTLANVRAGRGDPCKLAGLTVEDIASGVYDNGEFRLPTDAENVASYGSGTQFVGTREQAGYGLRIGTDNSTFLPMAGCRTKGGQSSGVYDNLYYWSSRPRSATNGCHLSFIDKVSPSNSNDALFGFAVRCVPQ